jgi:hypothetical protein
MVGLTSTHTGEKQASRWQLRQEDREQEEGSLPVRTTTQASSNSRAPQGSRMPPTATEDTCYLLSRDWSLLSTAVHVPTKPS